MSQSTEPNINQIFEQMGKMDEVHQLTNQLRQIMLTCVGPLTEYAVLASEAGRIADIVPVDAPKRDKMTYYLQVIDAMLTELTLLVKSRLLDNVMPGWQEQAEQMVLEIWLNRMMGDVEQPTDVSNHGDTNNPGTLH